MSDAMDVDYLRGWIGGRETVRDIITERLVREYAAMMDNEPGGAEAPRAQDFCRPYRCRAACGPAAS